MSRTGRDNVMRWATVVLAVLWSAASAGAQVRVPPPEFESNYTLPETETPAADSDRWEVLSLGLLLATLAVGTWLAHRYRRRWAVFVLMIGALAWFGFVRRGCVCPIGAVQNVSASLFGVGGVLPWVVLGFFLAPLAVTLLFGRVFCGSVCPLGAIQDLFVLRPVSVPTWLAAGLRMLAYAYLALAVLLSATGASMIICRYDPFVAFFRLSGEAPMLVLGACLLVIGLFVARPYCRFLCPYGVLLSWAGRLSWKRVTTIPSDCISCRLCEESCPFDAIRRPSVADRGGSRRKGLRTLAAMLLLWPVLIAGGAWMGGAVAPKLSREHPTVALAERVSAEQLGRAEGTTDASRAFRDSGRTMASLRDEAESVIAQFARGGPLAGGFLGLVLGGKLVATSVRRRRGGYEPDRGACLACGRCFERCPIEHKRRKREADA